MTFRKQGSHLAIEDFKVRNMTANAAGTAEEFGTNVRAKAGLNRSLLDLAPGTIRRLLTYKSEWRGTVLTAVDPRRTWLSRPNRRRRLTMQAEAVSRRKALLATTGQVTTPDIQPGNLGWTWPLPLSGKIDVGPACSDLVRVLAWTTPPKDIDINLKCDLMRAYLYPYF